MTLRVVFMGSPRFAVPILESLYTNFNLVAVATQQNKPKGRGQKVLPTPVRESAEKFKIPILEPHNLKDSDFIEHLASLDLDVIVVAAFGKLLPPAILKMPRYGCINLHASLLPKYRGASPIPAAILAGDRVTGVTTIQMDQGMDTGDILLQEVVEISEKDTADTLHDKLLEPAANLVVKTIKRLEDKALTRTPQDETKATYTQLLKKTDGEIAWSQNAVHLERLVRAMIPWPVAYFDFRDAAVKLWDATVIPGNHQVANIADISDEGIIVGTSKDLLLIKEVQAPGKKRMKAIEFARGQRLLIGQDLK